MCRRSVEARNQAVATAQHCVQMKFCKLIAVCRYAGFMRRTHCGSGVLTLLASDRYKIAPAVVARSTVAATWSRSMFCCLQNVGRGLWQIVQGWASPLHQAATSATMTHMPIPSNSKSPTCISSSARHTGTVDAQMTHFIIASAITKWLKLPRKYIIIRRCLYGIKLIPSDPCAVPSAEYSASANILSSGALQLSLMTLYPRIFFLLQHSLSNNVNFASACHKSHAAGVTRCRCHTLQVHHRCTRCRCMHAL